MDDRVRLTFGCCLLVSAHCRGLCPPTCPSSVYSLLANLRSVTSKGHPHLKGAGALTHRHTSTNPKGQRFYEKANENRFRSVSDICGGSGCCSTSAAGRERFYATMLDEPRQPAELQNGA